MKKLFITCFSIFFSTLLLAQSKKNLIYFEAGGSALLYSFNYDRKLSSTGEGLGLRIGMSFIDEFLEIDGSVFVPVHINYVIGKRFGLELGAGVTLGDYANTNFLHSACAMFKYQSSKGFNLRLGWSPYSLSRKNSVNNVVYWWPGLSLGYAF